MEPEYICASEFIFVFTGTTMPQAIYHIFFWLMSMSSQ